MLASALSAAALVLLIAAPAAGGLAASAVFLIGVGYGPVFPNMIAVGAARFPAEVGRMTSIVVAGGALGAIVAPWIMGHAIAHISASASMEIALAFTIAMAALSLSLRAFEVPRRENSRFKWTRISIARRQKGSNLAVVRQSADGNIGAVCDSLRLDLRTVDPIEVQNEP